jgi:hypothetical protein
MSDPKLIAKWRAEFDEIQRRRKTQGFPPLTIEQANRLGRVVSVRKGVCCAVCKQHPSAPSSDFRPRESPSC